MHRAQEISAKADLDAGSSQDLQRLQTGFAHLAEFGEADLGKARLRAETMQRVIADERRYDKSVGSGDMLSRSDTSRMSPPSTSTWRSSRRSRLVPSSTAQPVTANAAMKTCLSPPFSADRRLGRIARLAEADYVGSGNPAISSGTNLTFGTVWRLGNLAKILGSRRYHLFDFIH